MSHSIEQIPAVDQLAEQIRTEHELALEGIRTSMVHALRCGGLLITAKEKVKERRERWLTWQKKNVPQIAERTCQAYMRLYRKYKDDPQRVADLSVRQALRDLAEEPLKRNRSAKAEPKPDSPNPGENFTIAFGTEHVTLSLAIWSNVYRAVAGKLHPDHGGDASQMIALNALNAAILNHAKAEEFTTEGATEPQAAAA
jgi:hypothetical protein